MAIKNRKNFLFVFGVLVLCLFLCCTSAVAVPNAPTITKVEGKNVVVGVTTYINVTANVTVEGNAEANKNIKIFDGATQIGTGVSDPGTGAYSIDVNLALGSHNLTAVANDISGDSSPSTAATIYIEQTNPTMESPIMDGGYWLTSYKYINYGGGNTITTKVADSGGSGLDFNTKTFELKDLGPWDAPYGVPLLIAGTLTDDGFESLSFSINTPNDVKQNGHKYELKVSIKDNAGNSVSRSMSWYYDNTPPAIPVVTKVYDPDHNVFTGDLEPITNIPVGGYVDYYKGMTIVSDQYDPAKRFKIKGNIWPVGTYNADPPDGFNAYGGYSCTNSFCSDGISLDYLTGDFVLPYNSSILTKEKHSFYCGFYDSAYNYTYTNPFWYLEDLDFINAAPVPPGSPWVIAPPWLYDRRLGTGLDIPPPYTVPTIPANASPNTSTQSVCVYNQYPNPVDYNSGDYKVCQEVLPVGNFYNNIAGVYNIGDSWADRNNNWKWDPGEEFVDSSGTLPVPSDGQTVKLYNARNLPFRVTDGSYMYIRAAIVGPPLLLSWESWAGYSHYQSVPLLPEFKFLSLAPVNSDKLIVGPNSVTVKVETFCEGYDGSTNVHGINSAASNIILLNFGGGNVSAPLTASWTYTNTVWVGVPPKYYALQYTGVLNTSSLVLSEGTYTVKTVMEDYMQNQATDTSYSFKIDKTAPNVDEVVPSNGSQVSSIPSFNAKIVDPDLADTSPPTGANLDLALDQIDPYKFLGTASATSTTSLTVPIDTPIVGKAVDHIGNVIPTGGGLPPGSAIQVWDATNKIVDVIPISGNSLNSNATITANAGNSMTVNMNGALTLTIGQQYSIYYLIPHFDSNNGIDRIASVPTMPAVSPGTYASRIVASDKVGNSGTTISTVGIQMDPPVGIFTLTPTPIDVYIMSTAPNERTEIVSSEIKGGLSGILVPTGTLVTINLSDANLGEIVEPDKNGISADGYQIATEDNGAAPGTIKFHIKAKNTTNFGKLTVSALVGAATGSCDVYMRKPIIVLTKSATHTSAKFNDTITYTIQYENTGNSNAVNTVIKEKIPVNTVYEPGSIKINTVSKTDADDNPDNGDPNIRASYDSGTKIITFILGTIIAPPGPGESGSVEFKVDVQ